ncbi:MAG: hypothetical protein PUB45_04960 [Bacteroidales bacterium]|nr:hypothetical protein [Bacteroidales bacterium]
MKKNLVVFFCAAAAVLAGCDENGAPELAPAELVSVSLLAQDNAEFIEEDITIPVSKSMTARIKGGGKGKTMVLTLAAGQDDAIFVEEQKIAGGKLSFDASLPVDIMVKDTLLGLSSVYELKVKNTAGVQIDLVASFAEENCAKDMSSDIGFAVAPDGSAYISYYRKATVVKDSVSTTDKYNSLSVVKWDGTSFSQVGSPAFTDASARSVANPISMGIKPDGTPVVMYKGAQVANFISVMEYKNGKWDYIGTSEGVSTKFTSSYGAPEFYYNPKTGNPGFFYTSSVGSSDPNYRNYADVSFNGTSWDTSYSSLGSDYPKYGDLGTSSDGIFYRGVCCNTSDAAYAVVQNNLYGYYVYKMTDSSWERIVANYKPAGEDYGIPTNLAVKAGPKGEVYVFAASSKAATMQLYKVNEASKTLDLVGNPFACTAGSYGSIKESASFAVSSKGQIVSIVGEKFYLLSEEGQWEYATDIAFPGTVESDYFIAYTSADSGVLAVMVQDAAKLNSINIYKFGPDDLD